MRLNTRPRVRWAITKADMAGYIGGELARGGGGILDQSGTGGGTQTHVGRVRSYFEVNRLSTGKYRRSKDKRQ